MDQGISYQTIEGLRSQNSIRALIKMVNLRIDFTKLAKIAQSEGKQVVAEYLVD